MSRIIIEDSDEELPVVVRGPLARNIFVEDPSMVLIKRKVIFLEFIICYCNIISNSVFKEKTKQIINDIKEYFPKCIIDTDIKCEDFLMLISTRGVIDVGGLLEREDFKSLYEMYENMLGEVHMEEDEKIEYDGVAILLKNIVKTPTNSQKWSYFMVDSKDVKSDRKWIKRIDKLNSKIYMLKNELSDYRKKKREEVEEKNIFIKNMERSLRHQKIKEMINNKDLEQKERELEEKRKLVKKITKKNQKSAISIRLLQAKLTIIKQQNESIKDYNESLEKGITYSITHMNINEPVCITKCWHVFERDALMSWYNKKKNGERSTCPECKVMFKFKSIQKLYFNKN